MDPERYRLVGEIFDAALELPSEERGAHLEEACGSDTELLREVERLLEHDRRTAGLLDHSPIAGAGPETSWPDDLEAGARIGSYRVERLLGRGGMGVVYLATRDEDDFRRRVAIKVVRDSGLPARDAWRFHRERQILASLEHPNIARLYDGGAAEDGRPYLVMEYVDGLSITEHCDTRRWTVARRLELFTRVCSAVQYAHRNLVIHRDLKPSNILVDQDGEPRLLDFGIAKLLEGNATSGDPQATREHQRILTLSYSSPEQLLGQPITTASDVYCLGLVLYELLCGASPFGDHSTPFEVLRSLDEAEPPRASAKLATVGRGTGGDGPALDPREVARRRGTSVEGLRRSLRGDLDTIVAKALRKEPERRYATASELEEDLRRHLEDRPIVAGTPGFGYRLRKLVRRNRASVSVAAVAGLLIVGLVVAFVLTLIAQVDRTEREKEKAERMVAFLIETFSVTDPRASVGETVTARELLDSGARRIAFELRDEPEVQAMMLDAMGRIYLQIGLLEPAHELVQRGLDLRLEGIETPAAQIVESLTHLGSVQAAVGQVEAADATLRRAVELGRSLDEHDLPIRIRALEALALLERQAYHFEASGRLYRQVLDLRRQLPSPDVPGLAQAQRDYGVLLQEEGQFEESRQVLEESLAARRRHYGARHPEVAESQLELARLEHLLGRLSEAEELYRQVLELWLEIYGEHHKSVADIKNALALTLNDQGKREASVALLREAMAIVLELSGKTTEYATMASNLAVTLNELGHHEEAEGLFAEALGIRRRALGERHPLVGQTYLTLGRVFRRRGLLDEAQGYFERAASIARDLPPGHRAIAYPSLALADLLLERGRGDEAEALLHDALVELALSHDAGHWRIAMATANLGLAVQLEGRLEEAEGHFLRSLELLTTGGGNDPAREARVLDRLVELYTLHGMPDRASQYAARREALGVAVD